MKKGYKESRKRVISYGQKKRRTANSIGHILGRNCLLKHVIEGNREGRGGRKTRKKK
jgi:hypothetical protein